MPAVFSCMSNAESSAAFQSIGPVFNKQNARVIGALRAHPGGVTREELVILAGLPIQTVTARIAGLIAMNVVEKKPLTEPDEAGRDYETRTTVSGRKAAVLVLA
jgi:hypothetical protein